MKVSKHWMVSALTLLLAGVPSAGASEGPSPEELVARSIAYHDPGGVWMSGEVVLNIETSYSDEYAERVGTRTVGVQLWLSPGQGSFRYTKKTAEDLIEYRLEGGEGRVTVNGSVDIPDGDRERLSINEPALYRDYFEYLYGMPMKLRDPGTTLDPQVNSAEFNGRDSWALRVTYDPEVGEDIWYFYFDKASFALTGYRFFHDEAKNDGEYIAFEGEIRDQETGMRLPKSRAWFFNADHRHLATDEIVSIQARTP